MATRNQIWILKLVPGVRFGGFLSALLIFSLLYPLFLLVGGGDQEGMDNAPALFFSLIIAYLVPVFYFITARADDALTELMPRLNKDSAQVQSARGRLRSVSRGALSLQLLGGVVLGLGHLSYVRGSVAQMFHVMVSDIPLLTSSLGTLLVWVVMTTVIAMLVQQAMLFAQLGSQEVRISLLNTQPLLAFGRVATYSSLAVIGALAMFPLLNLDSQFRMAESLPGLIATVAPLVAIFIIPVWPIHRRLSALKRETLTELTNRIEASLDNGDGSDPAPEKLVELAPLLVYRREIAGLSTWPFDVGSMTRLFLYFIIVPLTWAGAALIERLVDLLV
ncbi:MAG: hypothetical protein V7709_08630 [Halioglobus sp.]